MVKATEPPKPMYSKLLIVSYTYAAFLLAMSLWQLVTFSDFVPQIGSYLGNVGNNWATFMALVVIGLQIFALPFLLRLPLSRLARLISVAFVVAVPVVWTILSLQAMVRGLTLAECGCFLDRPLSWDHVAQDALFLIWGCLSFWLLGGTSALHSSGKK